MDEYERGFQDALAKAREAVAALWDTTGTVWVARADAVAAIDALAARQAPEPLTTLAERIKAVLVSNGVDIDGGSFHSWRCFDKERYPDPCDCTDEVVEEIIAAIKAPEPLGDVT
jgi:hypothetical protein